VPLPIYSVPLFEGQGLGTGTISLPPDPVNTLIWRDVNFYAGLGGTFALRGKFNETILWTLITPPDLFFFFDQKHLVQIPGDTWSLDLFPIGSVDVSAFGYSLTP